MIEGGKPKKQNNRKTKRKTKRGMNEFMKAKEKARKQKVIDDRAERKRLKELEKYKGKTKDEIKQMKRRDSIVDTNKSDQVKSLINLGLTKKEIKELKYEDDRVNKIIELTNK